MSFYRLHAGHLTQHTTHCERVERQQAHERLVPARFVRRVSAVPLAVLGWLTHVSCDSLLNVAFHGERLLGKMVTKHSVTRRLETLLHTAFVAEDALTLCE